MPKKKAAKQVQPKAPMTRRELSRWQKQKRQERLALAFVVTTIVLVAGILLFGVWREILSRPGQIVARVGNTPITLGALADEIKYRVRTLDRQIELTQSQVLQARSAAQSDPSSAFMVQFLEQQLQQLQSERFQISYGQTVLEDLIERELIKQELLRRGGSVTAADIDAAIQTEFQPQPPAGEPITDTAAITDTIALTPTPSPTPIPADAWKARYQETLQTYGISDADFRRYTMEPLVWRRKLQEVIGTTVPTTTEQVHVRHILVSTEEEARDIVALMTQVPTIDFAEWARTRSTDSATKDQGGDLGWFPRGVISPELEEAAFALPPGQISGVISTTLGFHVIKVEERDPNRPLTKEQLDGKIAAAFNNWLQEAQSSADIKRFFDSDKQLWLNKQIPASRSY